MQPQHQHGTTAAGFPELSNAGLAQGPPNNDYYDGISSNLHIRSLSDDKPSPRHAPVSPTERRRRYGSIASTNWQSPLAQLPPWATQRRGSESSTSSAASNGTTAADGAPSWSPSTTPETMSPTSPSSSLLLYSPPERASSKAYGTGTTPASPPSPSQIAVASCRPARARACSHSASRRFPNMRIESPLLEQEEHAEACHDSRLCQRRPVQETASISGQMPMPANDYDHGENGSPSNLHERRQQRHQKLSGNLPAKQAVRRRLSPLPPLPLNAPNSPSPSVMSPRTLKPSRSLPQLRDAAGPPPSTPLPPLPSIPKLSPFVLPVSVYSMLAIGPSPSSVDARPPPPTNPPPPPPSSDSIALTSSCSAKTLTASSTLATITDKPRKTPEAQVDQEDAQPQGHSNTWEDQIRRHRQLLEQFPGQPEQQREIPRLSRTHRSLGNLRARSKSHSRAHASSQDDTAAAARRVSHQTSSLSLRGSKMKRPSTANASSDLGACLNGPLPPLPPLRAPHVSIFEDDSEDESITVRKFVRSFFSRRTRSAEMQADGNHGSKHTRGPSSGSKTILATFKAGDGNNHNDRRRNCSASSSLSVATTIGASTVTSTTSTIALTNTNMSVGGSDVESSLGGSCSVSPRTSSEHSRVQHKGPLLSRMFARRSD